jgi:hypothetical protein
MSKLLLTLATAMTAATLTATEITKADTVRLETMGPYLGQEPPGQKAELFAPGLLTTDGIEHCFLAFSPDGRELYWTRIDTSGERPRGEILFMVETDSGWTTPARAPFSGVYSDHSPVFSPGGQRIIFSSNRPGGIGRRNNLWYVERTSDRWSEPVLLSSPPNSSIGAGQGTLTVQGAVYFTGFLDSVEWNTGIYRSRFADGRYLPPELLPDVINTKQADAYPFIAPDESYLIFGSSRPGGRSTETDLYIAFRKSDDSWTAPIHLGEEINDGHTVSFSFVTYDSKYLFFNRFDDETDRFYWIDARILDKYRPDGLSKQ